MTVEDWYDICCLRESEEMWQHQNSDVEYLIIEYILNTVEQF